MSVNLSTLIPESIEADWMPSASQEILEKRAYFLRAIREFFHVRNVMEVDTPNLTLAPVTDPHIESLQTEINGAGNSDTLYLTTSPEFYMKRLLAAGSGSIYQMGKVFRNDGQGKLHSPEFTMLEWYRPDFDHHALMHEVDELIQYLLKTEKADRITYRDAFEQYTGLNPFNVTTVQLQNCAKANSINLISQNMEKDDWLALLLTHLIEPQLGNIKPIFIYDFPASQAALARVRIKDSDEVVAERFELYYRGIELVNGYHELSDSQEQRKRFEHDLQARINTGKPVFAYDEAVLNALSAGLPDCAGVAAGVDRLFMLAEKLDNIHSGLSFTVKSR